MLVRCVVVFFALLFVVSCAGESESACSDTCERYGACFDDGLDVGGCTDRCSEHASENEHFTADIDRCEACMTMEGCSPPRQGHVAFDCFDECGYVLGETAVSL